MPYCNAAKMPISATACRAVRMNPNWRLNIQPANTLDETKNMITPVPMP